MNSKSIVCPGVLSICVAMLIMSGCSEKTSSTTPKKEPGNTTPPATVNVAPAAELPETIIEVNGEKFTRDMANAEIGQRLAGAQGQIPPERIPEIKSRMINQLVERFVIKTVLMAEVKKENITVKPEEVDQRLNKFKSTLPKEMKFEDLLKKNGITEERVREDIASDLKISKLFGPITNGIKVTDADISEYMEKNKEALAFPESVHARHILVNVAKTDDEKVKTEKKAKIGKLREQIVNGADFAAVAKENSDCPSKQMGGDLGKFRRGQMAKPFEDAAFAQATNVIGPVVETEFGYHIIQVMEHLPAGTAS
ncbi:MAG: peptidylprolyl isomerase, partial [Kiritimatiellae bacterium]|nr:peptidylprolyl isomerase [Kiritimatiellia bacterium]